MHKIKYSEVVALTAILKQAVELADILPANVLRYDYLKKRLVDERPESGPHHDIYARLIACRNPGRLALAVDEILKGFTNARNDHERYLAKLRAIAEERASYTVEGAHEAAILQDVTAPRMPDIAIPGVPMPPPISPEAFANCRCIPVPEVKPEPRRRKIKAVEITRGTRFEVVREDVVGTAKRNITSPTYTAHSRSIGLPGQSDYQGPWAWLVNCRDDHGQDHHIFIPGDAQVWAVPHG